MGEAKRRRDRLRDMPCAYCGAASTSVDHVPPRNLFTGSRTNLITVPACDEHNRAYSRLDEQFREFVSFVVGRDTPETRALRHDTARAMRRSRQRLEAFIRGIRFNEEKGTFEVPQRLSVMRSMAERITRGLYWHRFGEPMPMRGEVRSAIISDPTQIKEIVEDMFGQVVADGQFAYVLDRAPDNPSVVVAYLFFHARMIVSVIADWSRAGELIDAAHEKLARGG